MIRLKDLTPAEVDMLANSRFGGLKPNEIPADWRLQIAQSLIERGVIEESDEEELLP